MTSRARASGLSGAPFSAPTSSPTPKNTKRRGPLAPVEIATAGALSGLALVLGLLTAVSPVLNNLLAAMTTLPLAMVAVRMRVRTNITALAASILAAVMLGGISSGITVGKAAVIGVLVGTLLRRRTNEVGVVTAGLTLGVATGALLDAVMWVLAAYRDLVLESLRVSVTGYMELVGRWHLLRPITDWVTGVLTVALDQWWIWVPVITLVQVVVTVVFAHWLLGVVLARLELGSDWDPLEDVVRPTPADEVAPPLAPLPIAFDTVHFRYPGATSDALDGITLRIDEGEFVVVTGPNGSGKSTLALLLAGALPSSGTITRPGAVGLGRVGGVALLAQRSELQPVGDTVAEDVLWGLGPQDRERVDLDALLDRVGLPSQADAATRNLSGGQLQRLALAGAVARRPRLLISDESTAMVDQAGRIDLVKILASLAQRGTTVVHITHDPLDAAQATRVVRMAGGRLVEGGADGDSSAGVEALTETSALDDRTDAAGTGTSETGSSSNAASAAVVKGNDLALMPRFGAILSDGARAQAVLSASPRSDDELSHGLPRWHRPSDLVVHDLAHAYDVGTPWEKTVLTDVSFTLAPGDAVLITGENGSGKTTLARILTGLIHPTWGACTLGGESVTNHVGEVALSMQFARLQLQRPSVRADILAAAAAGPAVDVTRDPDRLVRSAMDEVGLPSELATRGIDQLSGGQMRRVALAGLLASDPRVLILDEPLAGLDLESRGMLLDTLEARRCRGLAVLVISHDTDGLDSLCRRRLTLVDGVLS